MNEYEHITQPFEPVFNSESQILILGSLPSVKSRQNGFYYGHPQNRFWKMLALIFNETKPEAIEAKKSLLLRHHLALYDSIFSCDIIGSSDASIKNVQAADLSEILNKARIKKIILNGTASAKYFKKYQKVADTIQISELPSTSPANAAFTLEKLITQWKKALI